MKNPPGFNLLGVVEAHDARHTHTHTPAENKTKKPLNYFFSFFLGSNTKSTQR
jgi:hypothetical protein